MSASHAASPLESPVVTALRKRIRGEQLSREEEALLATAFRKPAPDAVATGVPHERIEAMLEERRLRERG
jgi:hypothetical protein